MARIEAQIEREANARLAEVGRGKFTVRLTGLEQVTSSRGNSSFDFFHWDHDAKKWNTILSATLGKEPSDIVHDTVEKYLAAHVPRPAPCQPSVAPPQ